MKRRANNNTLEDKVVVDIKEALKGLQQLKNGINGITTALNGLMKNTGIKNLNNQMKQSATLGESLKKSFNLGAIYLTGKKVYNSLKEMNKEAVDYAETVNLFNVSFGKGLEGLNEYYEQALDFQERLEEKLGVNIEESMRYQALFNSMTKSMGLSAKYAYILSENTTKLGYDLASLYNIAPERAMTKLRAGLAGQTEPLRELGLDITEQSLKPIAQELGITESIRNMSQGEKTILRYIAVLRQATIAHGDFANTMESPANQLRIFNAQVTAFKRNMGSLWQGILGGILPYVNAIMMVINELLKMVAKLFGFEVSSQPVNVSASIGADDLADDLGTASGEAKELKNQLMGFDEINNITLNNGSGGSSGGVSGTGIDKRLLDAIDGYNNKMDEISNKVIGIRDNILAWLGFTRDINGELQWAWEDMNNIAKIISVIAGIIGGIYVIGKIVKLVQWLNTLWKVFKGIKAPITTFQNGLAVVGKGLFNTGKHAKGLINPLAKVTIGLTGLVGSSSLAYTSMKDLGEGTIGTGEAFTKMGVSIAGATASGALLGSVIPGVGTALGAVGGAIVGLTSGLLGYKSGLDEANIQMSISKTEVEELTNRVNELKTSYENTTGTIKDRLAEQYTELEYTKRLSDELKTIVDENGRIKEGYEERADVIINELNSALDLELEKNGNVITQNGEVVNSYEELQKAIDDTIAKKKKEAEQEAYNELYKESVKQEIKLKEELARAIEANKKAYEDYQREIVDKGIKYDIQMNEQQKEICNNLINTREAVEDLEEQLGETSKNSAQYYQYMATEQVKSTGIITNEMIKQGNITSEALQSMSKENADTWKKNYDNLENEAKLAMLAQSTTVADNAPLITEEWRKLAQNSIGDFVKALQQTSPEVQANILSAVTTAENLTPEMVEAWGNLGESSRTEYNRAVESLPEDVSEKVQSMTGKVVTDITDILPTIRDLGTQMSEAITKNVDGTYSINFGLNVDYSGLKAQLQQAKNMISVMAGNPIFGSYFTKTKNNLDSLIQQLTVQGYATGGFPEDGLFMANSRELVGRFTNGKTVVANNIQIIEGIKAGVYEAVMSAMSQNRGGSVALDIRADEGIIVKKASQGFREYVEQTGELPFPVPV